MALLKTANEEIDSLRDDLSSSQENYSMLSSENGRLVGELSKANEELVHLVTMAKKNEDTWESKIENLRSQMLASQDPLLQAFLYKLIRTNTFGEYINACGEAINPLVTTEAIELISMDHPDLDIKKPDYGYGKYTREESGWCMSEEMMKTPSFPLLDVFKACDHVLSVEAILSSKVNEDLMIKDLDKAGHICLLGSTMSPPRPNRVVAVS